MIVDCNLVRKRLFSCLKELSHIGAVVRKETESTCGCSSIKLIDDTILIADILRIDVVKTIKAEKATSGNKSRVEWYQDVRQNEWLWSEGSEPSKESGCKVDDAGDDSRYLKVAKNDSKSVYQALSIVVNETMHYTKRKEWELHDTVENLYLALNTELAGLCEIFQWRGLEVEAQDLNERQWDHAARKLAGVLVYCHKIVYAMPFDEQWITAEGSK